MLENGGKYEQIKIKKNTAGAGGRSEIFRFDIKMLVALTTRLTCYNGIKGSNIIYKPTGVY